MSEPVLLSLVIPAFNEEKLLPRCLETAREAIRRVTESDPRLQDEDFEIIVADNNSTDGTAEIARHYGARVAFEPINQISRARNAGAAAARGEWLLFIDADSMLDPRNLRSVLDAAAGGRIAAGGCLVALDEMPASARMAIGFWNLLSRSMRWAAGSFVFCRRDAFEELGGFTLELYAAEELDLSQRLKNWCRARGLRFVILTACPHVSSARKLHLYTLREQLDHLFRVLFRMRRTLRNREQLDYFYDGRR